MAAARAALRYRARPGAARDPGLRAVHRKGGVPTGSDGRELPHRRAVHDHDPRQGPRRAGRVLHPSGALRAAAGHGHGGRCRLAFRPGARPRLWRRRIPVAGGPENGGHSEGLQPHRCAREHPGSAAGVRARPLRGLDVAGLPRRDTERPLPSGAHAPPLRRAGVQRVGADTRGRRIRPGRGQSSLWTGDTPAGAAREVPPQPLRSREPLRRVHRPRPALCPPRWRHRIRHSDELPRRRVLQGPSRPARPRGAAREHRLHRRAQGHLRRRAPGNVVGRLSTRGRSPTPDKFTSSPRDRTARSR